MPVPHAGKVRSIGKELQELLPLSPVDEKNVARLLRGMAKGTLKGKCPHCRGVGCLAYTGGTLPNGDRIYLCARCRKRIASPTDYGYCSRYGIRLEKDTFWSPCKDCPRRSPVPNGVPRHGVCRHLEEERWEEIA